MKLYIKYMVSLRCKMMVKEELKKLNLHFVVIDLGVVEILEDISPEQKEELRINLLRSGLELLDDKKSILIEKIKNVIVEMIHYSDEVPKTNYSEYLSEKLNYDYTYLSNIFMEVKGITIQQFIIINKIERVKELILYDELNLTEISYKLHYSSVAHLSNQFKKITGLSPSVFRQLKNKRKSNLENM
jgi:AraC-like DNA-binding protein